MNLKKLTHRVATKKRSSHKAIALGERQALWSLRNRDIKKRMKRINQDFARGFKIIQKHPDTVTFFGSARFEESNPYYKQARELAAKISRELGLTVVTGGGPGIMEAANRGAKEACTTIDHDHLNKDSSLVCGDSVAMTIELPMEQISNPYTTHSADYYYFFSRKVGLAFAARAFVCFPGGFGTLDEFFEVLTLKQTGKIPDIPIILCGKAYWKPLHSFIQKTVYAQSKAIHARDMRLYTLTDDHDEVVKIISSYDPLKDRIDRKHKL